MEKLYTISEVADKLGLSTKTLRRWEETGKFIGNRTLGNQRRYTLTDIQILDAIKHGTISGSDDLLTIEQAAALFGVGTSTIIRWEDDGKIHPLITAGATFYPRHRLLAQMDELKASYVAPAPVSPTPIDLVPPRQPLTPLSVHLPSPTKYNLTPTSSLITNIVVTLTLFLAYHLFFSPRPVATPLPPTANLTQSSDPLDSLLDSTGNFHPSSLTTKSLSLTPASPPDPVPGALYFDAGTQALKLYKDGSWTDVSPTLLLKNNDASLTTGTGTLLKGSSQISVTNPSITPSTLVTLTFNADFSPAKKYWLVASKGKFTVYTDFPVSQDSPFTYLFINPNKL